MESYSTYVLNLAPKGTDHGNVLRMIYTQMDILRKGNSDKMFYAKENRMVVPIFFPMLKHADQPERRGIQRLKLGKGSNHSRWRYVLDVNKYGHYLPSCSPYKISIEKQFESSTLNVSAIPECSACANWSYSSSLI